MLAPIQGVSREDGKRPPNGQDDETKGDRLGNLPQNVLDKILVQLPLKEAIRMSILSKQWRFKWCSLSQFAIKFDCSSWDKEKAKSFVYRYLLYHNNEIDVFKIYGMCQIPFSELYTWIHILSLKGLKKSVIIDNCHSYFELPPSLFSFPQLEYLEVKGCKIRVPCPFKGSSSLTILHLEDVFIYGKELEILVNKCQALERLKLSSIQKLGDCIIRAPNLKYLELIVGNIRFKTTDKISRLHLSLYESDGNSQYSVCNILTALGDPIVPKCPLPIEISKVFYLKDGTGIYTLRYAHLSTIHLDGPLYLNDMDNVRFFLFILGGFQYLKELDFSVCCYFESPDSHRFPEDLQLLNFKKLETVRVEYNSHLSIVAEFLHLIIGRSPLLGTLEITKCVRTWEEIKKRGMMKCFKKRLRKKFQRLKEASPLVKIIYSEKLVHDLDL